VSTYAAGGAAATSSIVARASTARAYVSGRTRPGLLNTFLLRKREPIARLLAHIFGLARAAKKMIPNRES
jgi:hypothetical protein